MSYLLKYINCINLVAMFVGNSNSLCVGLNLVIKQKHFNVLIILIVINLINSSVFLADRY